LGGVEKGICHPVKKGVKERGVNGLMDNTGERGGMLMKKKYLTGKKKKRGTQSLEGKPKHLGGNQVPRRKKGPKWDHHKKPRGFGLEGGRE